MWSTHWLVLAAGDFDTGKFNAMTVGWGMFGTMWSKPAAMAVVRPGRYTYKFMETYDTFTLCAFPDKFRQALTTLGTNSGRKCDKIAMAGLTPVRSVKVAAPSFKEANLVIESRKMYFSDFDPDHFLEGDIKSNYPSEDYHRAYMGSIVYVGVADSYKP